MGRSSVANANGLGLDMTSLDPGVLGGRFVWYGILSGVSSRSLQEQRGNYFPLSSNRHGKRFAMQERRAGFLILRTFPFLSLLLLLGNGAATETNHSTTTTIPTWSSVAVRPSPLSCNA